MSVLCPCHCRQEKFGPGHHITLVSPTEVQQLLAGNWSSVDELVAACNLEVCGSLLLLQCVHLLLPKKHIMIT